MIIFFIILAVFFALVALLALASLVATFNHFEDPSMDRATAPPVQAQPQKKKETYEPS